LVTTNQSYESVSIDTPASETVIYCDPPYKGASQYAEKLDHKAFEAWVKNSPHKIYVSGYESDLKCVLELQHNSSFHARKNKAVIEKLFCNK
jgi:site-specific DNA-adenine methylase